MVDAALIDLPDSEAADQHWARSRDPILLRVSLTYTLRSVNL
jgi:hypothetical protein